MKRLLLLLLPVVFCMSGCGQSKKMDAVVNQVATKKKDKGFEWPKPIRDSEYWQEFDVDTLCGTLYIYVSGGTMRAKGFVRSSMPMQCSVPIYTKEDKDIIDSLRKASGSGDPVRVAYIYTDKGIKRVDGSFNFTANKYHP